MSKKLVYLLASGTLVGLLQWAVPAAYTSIFCEEEFPHTNYPSSKNPPNY